MVLGVPASADIAEVWNWRWAVFVLAGAGLIIWVPAMIIVPPQTVAKNGKKLPDMWAQYGRFLSRTEPLSVLCASFLVSASTVGFITYVGAWLRDTYGLTTDRIGMIFFFSGFGALVSSPVAGYLSDRLGKRRVVVTSSVAIALALGVIPHLTDRLNAVFAGFVLFGVTGAFRHAPLQALVTAMTGDEDRGALVALKNTMAELGIAIGAAVCGLLYVAYGYSAVGMACGVTTALSALIIRFGVDEDLAH